MLNTKKVIKIVKEFDKNWVDNINKVIVKKYEELDKFENNEDIVEYMFEGWLNPMDPYGTLFNLMEKYGIPKSLKDNDYYWVEDYRGEPCDWSWGFDFRKMIEDFPKFREVVVRDFKDTYKEEIEELKKSIKELKEYKEPRNFIKEVYKKETSDNFYKINLCDKTLRGLEVHFPPSEEVHYDSEIEYYDKEVEDPYHMINDIWRDLDNEWEQDCED